MTYPVSPLAALSPGGAASTPQTKEHTVNTDHTRTTPATLPAGAAVPGKVPARPLTAQQIGAQLAELREQMRVKHTDAVERRRIELAQADALDGIKEVASTRKRARRERLRDQQEAAQLAELYRKASRSGVRARIRADINRSAEVRALRVEMVRKASLWVGLPVLVAFGLWSTAGVQRGVAALLHLEHGSPAWWAAWAMEPALLAIVALIIVGRSALESSGGSTDWKSWVIEGGALTTSLALNITPSLTSADWRWPALVAESIGPLGAATTAFLIGLFTSYVAKAKPWDGAPRLADLDLSAASADVERAVELRQVGAPDDALLTQALDAPVTQPVVRAVTHQPAQPDAPVTQPADAADDAPVQPAQPAVTHTLTRVDAPPRRTREVVMRRPVSAPPADRDAALRQAADAVLTRKASIRGAARDADVPEATLRRHLDRMRAVAQPARKVNGHSFEPAGT